MRFQDNNGAVNVSSEAPVHAVSCLYELRSGGSVRRQTFSAWFRNLHEDKPISKQWMTIEQPLDGKELFIDALGAER
jgi:hypothetical protein